MTECRQNAHLLPDAEALAGRDQFAQRIRQLQEEIGQLQKAVSSHAVIDQASGVVISLGGLRPEQGFDVLRKVSQRTNTKLRDVAEQIVDWVHSKKLDDSIREALETALTEAASC
ncbi:ANTAR domain-containing protein [Streptomyces sp. NPDC048192]|uniref:ANTAR domain-containing protein n=1 Tax=Streptomyces sp. NPDC048192 TaxID=3365510 RepID=UPI003715432B